MGYVYVIHFSENYHHARHYIGYTDYNVANRLQEHRRGCGAKLLKAVAEAGIFFDVVRVYPGDRKLERQMKNRKKAAFFCPYCRPPGRRKRKRKKKRTIKK